MNKELSKNYSAKESEKKWQDYWEKEGIYKFNKDSKNPVFSIDTPPPYISSDSLHTGHAMSYVQAEIIVRYHRMKGENVFYPMGFDDNGLPTERFVEKKYNVNKNKITRKEFVDLCLRETKEGGKKYEEIWRKLGLSVDWSLLYSTISPLAQKISQRSFLDLYSKDRIYQEASPTFWCTQCQTSLAQADLEDAEEKGMMYDIEFKFENGQPAVISTTRPELIPACVALYANPKDNRYAKHAGNFAIVPITGDKIPVKTSEKVEMEKGTGLMMVCTWGDTEDIEKWKADKLETKMIIDKTGKLNEKAGKYESLKLKQAREEILKDLEKLGLIKNKAEISHTLNIHERCKHPVDFFVSPQWFVKILDLKDELKKRGSELNWYPKFMKVHLDNWVDGLKWDWCISRDRFYGVPIPVWRCANCGEIILPEDCELPVDPRENLPKSAECPECHSKNIQGEMQVMDTWMTSSITPLINNHWKEKDSLIEKKGMYPMSVRVQGFEIIRTWLFYTLLKSHLNTNSLPWKDVMISGWGLAKNGEKMSKSLGNFVTAESMLEKYGADALRYWACGATLGMNLRFSEDDMRAGQKLLTKIWNASRFVMMNLENYDQKTELPEKDLEESDRWILAELQNLIKDTTEQFEKYEFAKAKMLLEHFFWIKFTDNYIELIKGRLYGEDSAKKISAQYALYSVAQALIKLFAPILPHLSEEIFQQFLKGSNSPSSIQIDSWPERKKTLENDKLLEDGKKLLEIIAEIRKQKAEKGIKLGEAFGKLTIEINSEFIEKVKGDLKNISHAEEIEITKSEKIKVSIKK